MVNRKWGIMGGFALCGALAAVGVALHFCVGPVDWGGLAWPVNAWALAAYLAALVGAYAFGSKAQAVRWAMSYAAAVPVLASVVVATLVMGLVKQTPLSAGGAIFHHMLSFWPFVLLYVWMATVLGLVAIKRLARLRLGDVPFLLNHLGLFVVLLAATLGSADMQRLRMIARVGYAERLAFDSQGYVSELPFEIELQEFILEEYPPELLQISGADGDDMSAPIMIEGVPRRFASRLAITTDGGKRQEVTIDVNKPARVGRWKIYQVGYDESRGRWSEISVLELVSDPWLPAVYAGLIMMMLGAVCMFAIPRRRVPKEIER